MDMSDIHGTTSTPDDGTRKLGTVDAPAVSGTDTYGTDSHGTDGPVVSPVVSPVDRPGDGPGDLGDLGGAPAPAGPSSTGSTSDVVKEEARATGEQAKEGAKHVAEVGKDEVKHVAHETSQQAKELWQQTRTQLLDQSAQQQTRVADGLRSLSQELSGMARNSEQQGVASDLAQQASQRMGDVASWLDQRDPGSLVSEVQQFARQRPGTFLAAAAVIGLVGGRLSRGLVADHQDQVAEDEPARAAAYRGAHTGTTSGASATADPDAFPA